MILLDQTRAAKLIGLARDRFDPDLKEAELKALRDSASSLDPPIPEEDAPRPEVRAAFLRWLATDAEARKHIDPKGLRVYAATVAGSLDLRECRGMPTLEFRRCEFPERIILQSAGTSGLFLFDCKVPNGLSADRLAVAGPVYLRRSQFAAEIRLLGAKIEGNLECKGAKLTATGYALSLDGASIGGDVFFSQGFECAGAVRLHGAKIEGILSCGGAKLTATGDALFLDGASIGGDVFFHGGFECAGTIQLPGAEIGGDLALLGAQVASVIGLNLRLSGDLIWQGIRKSPETYLNLTGAKLRNLRDDRLSWPDQGQLNLDGLVYEELTQHKPPTRWHIDNNRYGDELPLKAAERIAWLMLQREDVRFEPQPWMQLAKHLESKGDKGGAKHVLYKFRCLQAKHLQWNPWKWLNEKLAQARSASSLLLAPRTLFPKAWPYLRHPNRSWAIAFAWLEEAPVRILWSIATTLILGTLIFAGANRSGAMITPASASTGKVLSGEALLRYPHFQPFIYTLENTLPLVKLGMDEKWTPDPNHGGDAWFPGRRWSSLFQWLAMFNSYWFLAGTRWFLILFGWFQAAVLGAALTSRFKS